jgi:hypothetical protein
MSVHQCYDQPVLSSNVAAFISKVPFLCECYRTPLLNLTQKQFYKWAVQTFEAHADRVNLFWDSSEEICDAELPRVLLPYYS